MTEQEAQALAVRLTRVWQPVKVIRCHLHKNFDWDADLQGRDLRHSIRIGASFYADASEAPSFEWRCDWEGHVLLATLSLTDEGNVEQSIWFATTLAMREFTQRTLAQWTPLFARNCWLSGGYVESTAHEKAEWIQGFSQEELQAWNFKV